MRLEVEMQGQTFELIDPSLSGLHMLCSGSAQSSVLLHLTSAQMSASCLLSFPPRADSLQNLLMVKRLARLLFLKPADCMLSALREAEGGQQKQGGVTPSCLIVRPAGGGGVPELNSMDTLLTADTTH
ncbi:hypothetical protein PBY51_018557 [Eleginops maclovinus]|uniref:Uncharacterized protein n=1 Tax=Eleginops maclovinus TaxID=56733 RepID=A0AAN8AY60_ELEMC|nr:hypothetical protein PBY51_018557 [Eleginops maclovinus]